MTEREKSAWVQRERENRVFRSFAHGSLLSTVNYTCKIKILAAIATEKTGEIAAQTPDGSGHDFLRGKKSKVFACGLGKTIKGFWVYKMWVARV